MKQRLHQKVDLPPPPTPRLITISNPLTRDTTHYQSTEFVTKETCQQLIDSAMLAFTSTQQSPPRPIFDENKHNKALMHGLSNKPKTFQSTL